MGEIRPLSGFRFLAAFYVFIFHLNMPFRAPLAWLPAPLTHFVEQGRLGVTAFFVLSGFVLVYSHLKEFGDLKAKPLAYWGPFMLKRLARIYPVFIVGLIAFIPFSWAVGILPHAHILLLSATFMLSYFPSLGMYWYYGGGWSVANEFFFYLLFPLALPTLLRVRTRGALLGLILACAGVGTALGFWAWHGPTFGLNALNISFVFPPSRFPEFLAGMATAVLVLQFKWKIQPWVALVVGAVTAAYLAWVAPLMGGSAVVHNWLMVPFLAVLFSAITFSPNHVFFSWLGTNWLRYLGLVSYAFYIAQIPLSAVLDWLVASHRISPANPWVWPAAFATNLLAAMALHHFVELPAHRWIMAWRARHYQPKMVSA